MQINTQANSSISQVSLHSTTDAGIWAEEFVRINGGDEDFEHTMMGWFNSQMAALLNAISVGIVINEEPVVKPTVCNRG